MDHTHDEESRVVDGIECQITYTSFDDAPGLLWDVYALISQGQILLTEDQSFDAKPTDEQIREALAHAGLGPLTTDEQSELARLEAINAEHGDDSRLESSDFFDRLILLRARKEAMAVAAATPKITKIWVDTESGTWGEGITSLIILSLTEEEIASMEAMTDLERSAFAWTHPKGHPAR